MNIVLIGAGNVATHLGIALAKAGHRITQVYSRTAASASELTQKLNTLLEHDVKAVKGEKATSCKISWTTDLHEISPVADLYLVMLKDAVLGDVLPKLVACNPQGLFVHTAGSVPMSIWEGLTTRYGVLYPMQTFSKARAVDFTQVHFFVEASRPNDAILLKELASQLSDHVVEASSEQRKYLHLSAVFACNFTNHMYAICEKLLTAHGLPFSSMFPLIDETARKIHQLSPVDAQTGPAQRNDRNVMQRQETLLQDEPQIAELYRLISEHIVSYQQEREK